MYYWLPCPETVLGETGCYHAYPKSLQGMEYICIGKNSCRLTEKIASNEGLKFNQCSKDFFAVFRKLLLKDWSAYIAG